MVTHLDVHSKQGTLLSNFSYLTNSFAPSSAALRALPASFKASTNLINWSASKTNQTTFTNFDLTATNFPSRFYRVLFVP
jgi:hypothetical protein